MTLSPFSLSASLYKEIKKRPVRRHSRREWETSAILYLHPGLVKPEEYTSVDAIRCNNKLRGPVSTWGLQDTVTGIYGDPTSPLFGKKNMATFERMYINDKEAHKEEKQPYFSLWNSEEICNKIMTEFNINYETGHISVKFKEGESPIKANGKLILIDGGMSTTYRKQRGIAGYTLIYNSYGLAITSHLPFESIDSIVEENGELIIGNYYKIIDSTMAVHTVGTALGSAVAPVFLNTVGGKTVLIIAGVCQFISSMAYYIYMKSLKCNEK